jgi:hypothetical protein
MSNRKRNLKSSSLKEVIAPAPQIPTFNYRVTVSTFEKEIVGNYNLTLQAALEMVEGFTRLGITHGEGPVVTHYPAHSIRKVTAVNIDVINRQNQTVATPAVPAPDAGAVAEAAGPDKK